MDKIFGAKYTGLPLTEFSPAHLGVIFFLIITNFILLFYLKKKKSLKYNTLFRYIAASIMLIHLLSFQIWSIAVGFFTFKDSLPLHLCDVAILLSALMLLTKNKYLFEISFFWGLSGSLLAILTPDITQSFPHFNFINYFLSHGGIITCVLYMVLIENRKIKLVSVFRVFIITNLYMVMIAGINILLKSNYLYICRKPSNPSLIDLLGPWPWYNLSLEGVCILLFFVLYLPFVKKQFSIPKTPKNIGV